MEERAWHMRCEKSKCDGGGVTGLWGNNGDVGSTVTIMDEENEHERREHCCGWET